MLKEFMSIFYDSDFWLIELILCLILMIVFLIGFRKDSKFKRVSHLFCVFVATCLFGFMYRKTGGYIYPIAFDIVTFLFMLYALIYGIKLLRSMIYILEDKDVNLDKKV